MNKKWCIYWGLVFSASAYGAETDQYLSWKHKLQDSKQVINNYLNSEVRRILDKANKKRKPPSCKKLIYKVGFNFIEGLEKKTKIWAEKNEAIDIFPPRSISKELYFKKSILRDRRTNLDLSSTLNVNGIYFGTDKISHSISMGFSYFMTYDLKMRRYSKKMSFEQAEQKAKEDAIELGIWTEKNILGRWTTGELSYADLESNYQGFEMLKSLCDHKNPRIQMVGGAYKLTRPIDFAHYVNPKWDESYYPNHHSKRNWVFIKERLKKYCYRLNDNRLNSKFAYYRNVDKPTFNSLYIDKLIAEGELPDPKPQGVDQACIDHGLLHYY